MDNERKINMSEGMPLNSANIILNTGKNTKLNSPNGTVIHLKSEKSSASDLGLHINTTFSIASSKKIKVLFVLNFLLSVMCMIISCSIAFYYWNELIGMRRQLDVMKDQLIARSLQGAGGSAPAAAAQASALVLPPPSRHTDSELSRELPLPSGKKYFVDGLEEDLHFYKNKYSDSDSGNPDDASVLKRRDLVVAHFVGGGLEKNLRTEAIIGPWALDHKVSTKDVLRNVELRDSTYVSIKEDGLYLFYAQIVYVTNTPNCFYVWAQKSPEPPRLLSTCASADVASERPLRQSQISCSVQTVARLSGGDVVNFAQRERNATVLLKAGSSYFGLVRLSS